MATVSFNGTQNVTTQFVPGRDQVVFDGINVRDVRAVQEVGTSVVFTLNSGITLTLQGVVAASLTSPTNFLRVNSDITPAFGTSGADTGLTGNLSILQQGDDSITVPTGTNGALIFTNQGNDSVTATGTINGDFFLGQGNDSITGFGSGSVVYGGLNGTVANGAGLVDVITAATDITAGLAGVTVFGGNGAADAADGADLISGSNVNDVLFGNGGNDTITGNGGRDSIYGGQGNDVLTAGVTSSVAGGSVMYGGAGADLIVAGTATFTAGVLSAVSPAAAGAGGAGFTLFGGDGAGSSVDGNDTIVGSQGNDQIFGNGGDDLLVSSGGRDSIYGGQGNDTVAGITSFTAGVPTLEAAALNQGSLVYGGLGNDVINVAVSSVSGAGATSIFGGNGLADAADGADTITIANTSTAAVTVFGNGGNDTIVLSQLSGVNDTVFGGAGNDTITARGSLTAGTGGAADTINGGGNDVLFGGQGADTFVFQSYSSNAAASIDRIADFNANEDKIDLAAIGTGQAVTGVFNVTNTSATTIADIKALAPTTAGTVTVVNVTGGAVAGTYVVYGAGATDGNDQIINITGFTGTIDATDFI